MASLSISPRGAIVEFCDDGTLVFPVKGPNFLVLVRINVGDAFLQRTICTNGFTSPLAHLLDKDPHVWRSQPVILLPIWVNPAVRPPIARRTRTAHDGIYLWPTRLLTRNFRFRLELLMALCEHTPGG